MRKFTGLCVGILANFAFAGDDSSASLLDTVSFQLSAKQWVTTKTALLVVDINATLNSTDLVKVRADLMAQLNKISKGDWHLTRFDRSQDNSGLEKLYVRAETRVEQSVLTSVYTNAKAVSKPGESYTVSAIEFKPSLEEMQQVRLQLREQLYQQAQEEIARLNKVYHTQQFSLYRLNFVEGMDAPQTKYQAREAMNMVTLSAAPAAAPLTVSNELVMSAVVDVASNRASQED